MSSAMPESTSPTYNVPLTHSNSPIPKNNNGYTAIGHAIRSTSIYPQHSQCMLTKIPLDLSRLFQYNWVDLKELSTPHRAIIAHLLLTAKRFWVERTQSHPWHQLKETKLDTNKNSGSELTTTQFPTRNTEILKNWIYRLSRK